MWKPKDDGMDLIEELRQRTSYLSSKEVMDLLDVTRNTLCEWVRAGRLAAFRVGNAYIYDPRILAEWLEKRQTVKTRSGRSS